MPGIYRPPGARSIRWRLGGDQEGPFLGGLNVRDDFTMVAANELADATNFTLDERGVAIKRNDCPASANFPAPPGAVTAFYYSNALAVGVIQVGTGLYYCALGGGSWTAFRTATSSKTVSFSDFAGSLFYTHPDDGTRWFNIATDNLANANVKGGCITSWQNKLWVGSAVYPPRLFWSLPASATFNDTVDFVDIREKSDKAITALFGGSGLLVFKEDSTHRVNDSTQGAYQTIDWNTGCVGPLAVCGSDEGIFVWGLDGLYRGNGLGTFELVGDKLRPRFLSTLVNATTKPLIAGVYLNGRVYFAFPRVSSTIPEAIIEYNPRVGWLMESYFAARVGPFARYLNSSGVPTVSFASGSGTIKDLYTGTTRTGFAVSLTTGFAEPFGGYLGRIIVAHPQLTLPAAASPVFGINYLDEGDVVRAWTATLAGPTAGGTYRPRLQPRLLGSAYAVTFNDTASPLNSLSVLGCDLSALLTALR